ncbi:hypothetical protein ACFQGW_14520 [Xanthomonas theicola]|uniref:hypothetical protein n=1 Tax=Xanthomonas theicola TaxID=56464 RepID=UPI00360B0B96
MCSSSAAPGAAERSVRAQAPRHRRCRNTQQRTSQSGATCARPAPRGKRHAPSAWRQAAAAGRAGSSPATWPRRRGWISTLQAMPRRVRSATQGASAPQPLLPGKVASAAHPASGGERRGSRQHSQASRNAASAARRPALRPRRARK